MKQAPHIFGKINLLLFLLSFALLTLSSYGFAKPSQDNDHIPHHIAAKQESGADGSSQQLSEKNETETETENDLELQALILPFSVSYLLHETLPQPAALLHRVLAQKTAHPIYVSVHNFRI